MPQLVRRASGVRRTVAALFLAGAIAGCSGSSDGDSTASPASTSGSTSGSSSSGAGTTTEPEPGTTPPGITLALGKPAVVRYRANPAHDSLIRLTVNRLTRGKLKDLSQFRLSDSAKKSNVYYVRATLKNIGDGDLGGQPVQLYGKVSADLVVPPVIFRLRFDRCDYSPLAKPFKPGDRASVCVVLLAPRHGKVTAVQWRPADNSKPITWKPRH